MIRFFLINEHTLNNVQIKVNTWLHFYITYNLYQDSS
jgi:hypothetical protein